MVSQLSAPALVCAVCVCAIRKWSWKCESKVAFERKSPRIKANVRQTRGKQMWIKWTQRFGNQVDFDWRTFSVFREREREWIQFSCEPPVSVRNAFERVRWWIWQFASKWILAKLADSSCRHFQCISFKPDNKKTECRTDRSIPVLVKQFRIKSAFSPL